MALALVALAFLVAVYQMFRWPVLRRLALREVKRRRGETLLVIAGSLLGTAIIAGSFIVGDTLDSSIRVTATTQLGPVDEVLVFSDLPEGAEAEEKLTALEDPRIDGVTSLLRAPASIYITREGVPLVEPSAQLIEMDFDEGRSFGGDAEATGLQGATPGPGEVALGSDLAQVLEARVGERVTASLYGEEVQLDVVRVLPRLGLAGFWTGIESSSVNAFVAPGTLAELGTEVGTPSLSTVPPLLSVLVSNAGGVEEGAVLSAEVTELIKQAVGDPSIQVQEMKKDRLDSAKVQGEQFSQFFVAIGAFAVIAGILLLVQIFVMLAEERKSQLGMLRAVGLRRSDLVRTFFMQGAIYALPAGILGALLGIGVGWAIVKVAAPIFGGGGDFSLDLKFAMEPASLINGFCIGVIISLVTVLFTSIRISRINIIRAIRDLQEPKKLAASLRTVIVGVVTALAGGGAFAAGMASPENAWPGALLGPPVALFALLPLLGRIVPRRASVLLVASLSLAWGILGDSLAGGKIFGSGDIFAFVLQGVLLNVSAVILLSQVQENLGHVLGRVSGRSLSLRLGLSYPLARRFRTGLTLGMFSLVIFTMVFISALSNVFGGQVENSLRREAGGYEIIADSLPSNPPRVEDLQAVAGIEHVSAALSGAAQFSIGGGTEMDPWPVTGIDDSFLAATPPELEELAPGILDDAEAWRRVATEEGVALVPQFFLQEGGGGPPQGLVEVGDIVTMSNPLTGTSGDLEVIGFTSSTSFRTMNAYMSSGAVKEVLGDLITQSRFFVDASDGEDPAVVAQTLQGELLANGVEAETFRSIVEENQALSLQFFKLMQGYLALGLLVGIAGIGVVMVRAVRERRRQVGVLRSLGFRPRMIGKAFILESAFTALEGILVGTVLALITAYQLIQTGEFGEGVVFTIPWFDITVLLVVSLVASLLATAWPARQAAAIPPAVALRIAD